MKCSMRKLKLMLGGRSGSVTRIRPTACPKITRAPVVKRNPNEDVFQIALYMDAVPYSLTGSVAGIWLVNLLPRQRHSMSIVRTRIGSVNAAVGGDARTTPCVCLWSWCSRCLAGGVLPSTRHDRWSAISARLQLTARPTCWNTHEEARSLHPNPW